MPHVAVIGAGITGITTAYALLLRGYQVTVVEQNRYAAMETSFANGGQLSASNAEVWTSLPTIAKGLRWLTRHDAPLLLNLSPSWHKYSWLAEFLGQIPAYAANTIQSARLAVLAREHLLAWAEHEQIAFDREPRGILHVYRTKAGFDHSVEVSKLLAAGGVQRIPLSPGEIRKIEPALREQFYGGCLTESDFTGDVHKFSRGLAQACARRGAVFLYEALVRGVSSDGAGVRIVWESQRCDGAAPEELRADAVVICAGTASRRLAAMLGDRVNIYPVKGYSITVGLTDELSQGAAPWVGLVDDDAKIVTSRLGKDRLRVAGTAEINGFNRDIRSERIAPLVAWTRRLFPDVATSSVVPWAGLRPMTPSMLPRVGRGRIANVFYNTGHGHLGWTMACATAEILAELMTVEDQRAAVRGLSAAA